MAFMPVTRAETNISWTVKVGIYKAFSNMILALFWMWRQILPMSTAFINNLSILFIAYGGMACKETKFNLHGKICIVAPESR